MGRVTWGVEVIETMNNPATVRVTVDHTNGHVIAFDADTRRQLPVENPSDRTNLAPGAVFRVGGFAPNAPFTVTVELCSTDADVRVKTGAFEGIADSAGAFEFRPKERPKGTRPAAYCTIAGE